MSGQLWEIEPFERHRHDRIGFDCGVPALNDWLATKVSQYEKRDLARTYVLVEQGRTVVKGYYALSNHTVMYEALPKDEGKGLPHIDVPVVLIGRLAVDVDNRRWINYRAGIEWPASILKQGEGNHRGGTPGGSGHRIDAGIPPEAEHAHASIERSVNAESQKMPPPRVMPTSAGRYTGQRHRHRSSRMSRFREVSGVPAILIRSSRPPRTLPASDTRKRRLKCTGKRR